MNDCAVGSTSKFAGVRTLDESERGFGLLVGFKRAVMTSYGVPLIDGPSEVEIAN